MKKANLLLGLLTGTSILASNGNFNIKKPESPEYKTVAQSSIITEPNLDRKEGEEAYLLSVIQQRVDIDGHGWDVYSIGSAFAHPELRTILDKYNRIKMEIGNQDPLTLMTRNETKGLEVWFTNSFAEKLKTNSQLAAKVRPYIFLPKEINPEYIAKHTMSEEMERTIKDCNCYYPLLPIEHITKMPRGLLERFVPVEYTQFREQLERKINKLSEE